MCGLPRWREQAVRFGGRKQWNMPEEQMKNPAMSKIACIDERSPNGRQSLRRRLVWLWRRLLRLAQRTPRRLRLCESLPLGDRRFVAVIEFEKTRFLVGGTSASLALLARLDEAAGVAAANDPAAAPGEERG